MEFLLATDGMAYPVSYRQDGLGINRSSVEYGDTCRITSVRVKMQSDNANFAGIWMWNIRVQQFSGGLPRRKPSPPSSLQP